jgi:hypothetical protein
MGHEMHETYSILYFFLWLSKLLFNGGIKTLWILKEF